MMDLGQKITILGNAGSGKSTLSNHLASQLQLPVYHLDRFFWTPNWIERDEDEFLKVVREILDQDQWIMDGNYTKAYFKERLFTSSTVIFFDYNRFLVIYRIIKRYFKNKGKERKDICTGCSEKMDLGFIRWVWTFNKRVKSLIIDYLKECRRQNIQVYIFKNRKELKEFLKRFEESL